jgi:hypothetical protein
MPNEKISNEAGYEIFGLSQQPAANSQQLFHRFAL